MRRVILGLLLSLVSFAAHAACPGNPPTCGNPMTSETSGSVMYATAYGVKADGTTSDDVALKAAVDACAAKGTRLLLPPGRILLTGAASITLSNCHLMGVGVPTVGVTIGDNNGTTFVLTNRTVKPFLCRSNWALTGMIFFWPNQTGADSYLPLISDDGTVQCGLIRIENVIIVNAYDGIKQTSNLGWGNWTFKGVQAFAAHDLITLQNTGDGLAFNDVRVEPGAWLLMGGTNAAVGTAASTQTVFHIKSGGTVNLGLSGVGVIGARYGFYLDAGAVLAESNIAAGWDVVATIVDTSAGGTWSSGINFSGANASCATPATTWGEPNGGNQPCFNLGANGELTLMNFLSQGANGSFIVTAGSNVSLRNTDNRIVGGILDGGDYAQIKITGGNPGITVQNGLFGGTANTTNNQHLHVHGIVATGHTPSGLVMTDNTFLYQTDVLVSDFSASTMISGNVSAFTAGASSIILTGLGSGLGKNTWDKPPVPTIESGFGTAPAMTVGADFLTFLVDTGTGATRNNGVVDIPVAAPVGYVCSAVNQSNSVGSAPVVTAATNHSVVLSNYSRTTGIGLNWSDHDRVAVQCRGF